MHPPLRPPERPSGAHFARALALLSLLPALAACTWGDGGDGGRAAAQPPAEPPATPVAVVEVARRDLARTLTVTAPVEAVRTIGVNSRAEGTILEARVVEGDRVAPGQLLARLDAGETEAQLTRARARLTEAETAFRRAGRLRDEGVLSDAEYETAEAAYEVAASEVELWETRLAFHRVLAPAAGVVTAKHIEAGTAVSPNQRLFDLADTSLLVARCQVSELDVVLLAPGQEVEVRLDAFPGEVLAGRVRRVFPGADPASRLVPVEVALPVDSPLPVRPGFLARVSFPLERRPGVLVVPAAALGSREDGAFALVVGEGEVLEQRAVAPGLTTGGWVEILSGLEAGERVVTSGLANLRPGQAVRVREAA